MFRLPGSRESRSTYIRFLGDRFVRYPLALLHDAKFKVDNRDSGFQRGEDG
jgi:hypothetical protein